MFWVVSTRNIKAYTQTGYYKKFFCYMIDSDTYYKIGFKGRIFLSAVRAIEFMIKEAK